MYNDYETVQVRFYTGNKRQFVVIDGWLLNQLLIREKLDKRQLPEWIENHLTRANSPQLKFKVTKEGRYGGAYVCRELIIAYATWISADDCY